MPDIHVAICCHDPGPELDRLLSSLANCRGLERVQAVWLVENGYTQARYHAPDSVIRNTALHHVCLEEKGVARARQWLVEKIQRGFVIFLDSDVTVADGLVAAYADAVDTLGGGVIFGGPLDVAYEERPADWLIPHLPRSARGWDPGETFDPQSPDAWFMGANFGAFCEDIVAAGGFDVRLGPGGQGAGQTVAPAGHEFEMQSRMKARGIRLQYLPEARVTHNVPAENCTPSWLLTRIRRNSIRRGMLGVTDPDRYPSPGLRKIVLAYVQLLRSLWSASEEQRLARRKMFYRVTGYFEGRRLARRVMTPDG